MSETLAIFGNEYENVAGFKVVNANGDTLTYVLEGSGGGGYVIQDSNGNIILPSEGGGEAPEILVPENDVIFMDYDGTILYSYSTSDFMNLTEMPANPSHRGLIAQGWNWDLIDAKNYVMDCGQIVIGQMYITESGATEVDLQLVPGVTDGIVSFALDGEAQIDFGDGSNLVTVTGTSVSTRIDTQHDWPTVGGDFTLKIIPISGTIKLGGQGYGNGQGSWLYWAGITTDGSRNYAYRNCIRRIRVGQIAEAFSGQPFSHCRSLESVSLPVSVTNISDYAFSGCTSLFAVVCPKNVTYWPAYGLNNNSSLRYVSVSKEATSWSTTVPSSCYDGAMALKRVNVPEKGTTIGAYSFRNCYALSGINIPEGITLLKSYCFYGCQSLITCTLPSTVTNIEAYAFQNCYSLKEIHLLPTTPPTLAGTSAFTNVPSDCIFYVPSGCLTVYQEATNWSTYANQMQEEVP